MVLSDVQWKKLWVSSVWHEEQEGMCTGYRYGTAFVMSCRVLCRYVDTICSVGYLSVLFVFGIFVIDVISSLLCFSICCISQEYLRGFLY